MAEYIPDTALDTYELRQKSVVTSSTSSFTGSQQVYAFAGKWYELSIDIAPVKNTVSRWWRSFYSRMNGIANTFLFTPFKSRYPQENSLVSDVELITAPAVSFQRSAGSGYVGVTDLDSSQINRFTADFTSNSTTYPTAGWQFDMDETSVYVCSAWAKSNENATPNKYIFVYNDLTTNGNYIGYQGFTLDGTSLAELYVPNVSSSPVTDRLFSFSAADGYAYSGLVTMMNGSIRKITATGQYSFNTATNGSGNYTFGTFSGATTTGFTAGHDGSGSFEKHVYFSLPYQPRGYANTGISGGMHSFYKVTFDLTINSGSGTIYVGMPAADGTIISANVLQNTFTTAGSKTAIIRPSASGTSSLTFSVPQGNTINFTVANIVLTRMEPTFGVVSATAGSTSFTMALCPVSTYGILHAGDFISISNNLYQITDDVSSNSSGIATVNVFPSIRSSYAANTLVRAVNPTGTFRLVDNSISYGNENPGGYVTGMGLTAREAF